ncbi:MAG: hypothetical protein H7Z42_08555 [Roseiflexaceae bacterium]|nr:hypothetical protein [Roseiflexaceae bacterium]
MPPLAMRQVHLDFHTSPHIPEIAADFDPHVFANTLHRAHVDSVTVFAKCHHGYSYYPTELGTPHPHLLRPDLLGEMIAACQAVGIRTPIYTTVTWDELAWHTQPAWRQIAADGGATGPSDTPLKPGWKNMCMNTGYGDYVIAQIDEVIARYPVDGVFVDISSYIGEPCVCGTCLAQMQAQGLDPLDPAQRERFALEAERGFLQRCTAAIRANKPDLGMFYNSRLRIEWDPALGNRSELDNFTHLEIESLPGGFWGYGHFPLHARFFQTFGYDLLAMTGRFHTAWGDFGGLRSRAALEFECFQALAHGAACSIGDQLHPRGRLDPTVYRRIGEVYAEVQRREAWVVGSTALPEIGVLTAKGQRGARGNATSISDVGAMNLLEQLQHQFVLLDAGSDFSPYQLLVLSEGLFVDAALAERLQAYLASGGRVLATSDANSGVLALAAQLGVEVRGPAPFAPDYLALSDDLAEGIEPFAHVCELPGVQIAALPGAQVLAHSGQPYFNRTWQHFCSHLYTPLSHVSDDPLVVATANSVFVARPLLREYAEQSRRVHRLLLRNCIRRLLPQPRVDAPALPTSAIVTVRRQRDDLIVHLLHYVHQRRGTSLDIIEDVLPLHNLVLRIRAERKPTDIVLVPEQQPLDWTWREGYAEFTVPQVRGYQIVQITQAATAT